MNFSFTFLFLFLFVPFPGCVSGLLMILKILFSFSVVMTADKVLKVGFAVIVEIYLLCDAVP